MRTVLTALMLALLTACATYKDNAGKLLASTALTVDATMRGWGAYVRLGKATDDQQAKVRAAYEQYQLAMQAAQAAFTVLIATGNQPAWTTASSTLTSKSTSLTALVQSFQ